jgi:hypothetical protein
VLVAHTYNPSILAIWEAEIRRISVRD